jgi:hypothetical protein
MQSTVYYALCDIYFCRHVRHDLSADLLSEQNRGSQKLYWHAVAATSRDAPQDRPDLVVSAALNTTSRVFWTRTGWHS